MAWARVNTGASAMTDTGASPNTNSVTTASLTAGNRLLVVLYYVWGAAGSGLTSPPSDGHNTYTLWKAATVADAVLGTYTVGTAIYSAPITTGGVQTISATVSGGSTDNALAVCYLEYSGLDTSAGTGALDASGSSTSQNTTSTGTATSTTTTAAGQLVLSAAANAQDAVDAFSWGSGTPTQTKIAAVSFDNTGTVGGAAGEATMSTGTTASANWSVSANDSNVLALIVAKLASGGSNPTGTGAVVFNGAGVAQVVVTGTGAGNIVFNGTGTAVNTLTATGTGNIVFNGTGSASGSITATGTGAVVLDALTATATVTVTASGTGAITFGGAGVATLTVTATGTGNISFNGTGSATGVFTASGTGNIVFNGNQAGAGGTGEPIAGTDAWNTGSPTVTIEMVNTRRSTGTVHHIARP